MTRRFPVLVVLLAALVGAAALATPRPAQAAIDVRSSNATVQFPNGIQFTAYIASDANITDVRLSYHILPDGVVASVRPTCTTGTVVNCQATVGNTAAVYMVPGAEVLYSWQITDTNGTQLTSDEQKVVYNDTRYRWDSITDGNISVHFYYGDVASQQTVMKLAQETIQKQSALLRTTVDFPVKVWVYKSAADMADAVGSRRGNGGNGSVQTLGEVGASDTALISRDTDFLNIVRHELAHIVTRAATRNHLAEIPIWINEGISIAAQNDLLPDEQSALKIAIQRNRILPITSLGASARGTADVVSLFYAESGAIIRFMIDTYGPDKFADFIDALAKDTTDGALNTVYGFDQLGLENAWRKSVGLPEVSLTGGNQNTQPQPTLAPLGSNQSTSPTPGKSQSQNSNPTPATGRTNLPASSKTDGGISLITVAVILSAVVVLLLATAAGVYFQSRRRPLS